MSSTYNYLGIELMATGENAGTWGTKTNTNLNIIQQAATGFHSQTIQVAHKLQLYWLGMEMQLLQQTA